MDYVYGLSSSKDMIVIEKKNEMAFTSVSVSVYSIILSTDTMFVSRSDVILTIQLRDEVI